MRALDALPLLALRQGGAAANLADLIGLHLQRRALSRLDAPALRDIGVSREEAEAEAARPVWDVPAHWRR